MHAKFHDGNENHCVYFSSASFELQFVMISIGNRNFLKERERERDMCVHVRHEKSHATPKRSPIEAEDEDVVNWKA